MQSFIEGGLFAYVLIMQAVRVQWNLDLTKYQGTGKISWLYREFYMGGSLQTEPRNNDLWKIDQNLRYIGVG